MQHKIPVAGCFGKTQPLFRWHISETARVDGIAGCFGNKADKGQATYLALPQANNWPAHE